jgi:hypothetical protein
MKTIIQPIRIRSGNFFNLLLILLFAIIGNPVTVFALGPISSVYSPARQRSEVFFKGNDGVLHHYYEENGTWQHDGTTFSGFPVADQISAIYAPQRSHTEVFYQGTDGLLHYWYKEEGSWQHDGTTFRGFPVGGEISAIYAPQRSHAEVFYEDTDGLLHYWYLGVGGWQHDGTTFQGVPVGGAISAIFAPQRNHAEVFYKGTDSRLHYWFVDGGWRHDGTTFSGIPVGGDISAIYAPQRKHAEVFYKGTDEMLYGKLHYWYVEGGVWRHGCFDDGVSYNAFSKPSFVDGDISATFATQRNHAEVFYEGEDNIIYYWYVDGGAWKRGYFNEMAVGGAISATFATQRSHSEFFYIGRDDLLHYYYVEGGAWGHDWTTFNGGATPKVAPNVKTRQGLSLLEWAKIERDDGCSFVFLEGSPLSYLENVFPEACSQHDICYSTTGGTKEECDNEFRDYMLQLCNKRPDEPLCDINAIAAFSAVSAGGQHGWEAGQKWKNEIVKAYTVKLTVKVKTGDVENAGTNANVNIRFFFSNGFYTDWRTLDKFNHDDFERNGEDTFTIYPELMYGNMYVTLESQGIELNSIDAIEIKHDNSGERAGWFVDYVMVNGYIASFGRWLEDGQLSAKVKCSGNPYRYRIELITSHIDNAGTDADVLINLIGDKGETEWKYLDSPEDDFERGKGGAYEFLAPDIGIPIEVRVKLEGKDDHWHLNSMTVKCLDTGFSRWVGWDTWFEDGGGYKSRSLR